MKSVRVLMFFITVFIGLTIINSMFAQSNSHCKVEQLIDVMRNNDNNVELSEFRNELLFDVVGSDCLITLLKSISNDTILQNKICTELETPVSDDINLQQLLDKLSSVPSEYAIIIGKMEKSINIAIDKYRKE